MQNELILENKDNLCDFVARVKILKVNRRGFISFPVLFQIICGSLRIRKQECWKIIFEARNKGFIDIIPFHGIKIVP